MTRSLFPALLLGLFPALCAATPMDCAKTSTAPVKFICEDATLEALDKEAARLAGLAAAGPQTTAARKELADSQASFRKTLVACRDARPCLERTLLEHIHRLREAYPEARKDDAAGISLGPFTAVCLQFDALIGVTFVNGNPALAFLTWRYKSAVLRQALAASGARYTGPFGSGEAQFWNKGKEATLDLPGKPSLPCAIQ